MRILRTLLLALFATAAFADQPGGTIHTMSLSSSALEGNLMGEPAQQEIAIYLPPGYESGTKRYPVLYLLHGIGGSFEDWTKHWDLRGAMDRIIFMGEAPFIVVMPNGANSLGGGFYVDSPVSGKWETYLLRELIPRIDADFGPCPPRPRAASPGIRWAASARCAWPCTIPTSSAPCTR